MPSRSKASRTRRRRSASAAKRCAASTLTVSRRPRSDSPKRTMPWTSGGSSARPLSAAHSTPMRAERSEGAVDVGVVADAHVQHRPAPALAVVDELGDLAVGDHALGAVEQADRRHPEPDGLHGARVAADLDDVADADEALEEDEEPRDHVLDEALGAEAHGEPEHPRRDEHAPARRRPTSRRITTSGDEGERVAGGVRHQRAERAGPLRAWRGNRRRPRAAGAAGRSRAAPRGRRGRRAGHGGEDDEERGPGAPHLGHRGV